jgi:hypothetical protein
MEAIKVFLSGGARSGKTVYLSSLFKSLSVSDKRLRLRCETSATARSILSAIYNRLGRSWPAGTELAEQHEMPFSFYIENEESTSFLAARTIFYDYAGGALTHFGAMPEGLRERMEEVKELADSCDVVMSVVDGSLVYESLYENAGEAIPELWDALDATLQFWTDAEGRKLEGRHNHYFLVTKWDLFDDSNQTLSEVRELLMNHPQIDAYLSGVAKNTVVRIIPVSAVGQGFARRLPGGTEMEITAKKPGSPINVDIPIASLLPDLVDKAFKDHLQELSEEAREEAERPVPWWKRFAHFIGTVIQKSPAIRRLATDFGIHDSDIERVSQRLKDPMIRSEVDREKKLAEIAAEVDSEEEAVAVLHNHFEGIRKAFEEKYPSSRVKG